MDDEMSYLGIFFQHFTEIVLEVINNVNKTKKIKNMYISVFTCI